MPEKTREELLRDHRNEENRKYCHDIIDRHFDEAIKRYGEPKLKLCNNSGREERHLGQGWSWRDGSAIDSQIKDSTDRGEVLRLIIELRHPSDPNSVPNLLENILNKNGK